MPDYDFLIVGQGLAGSLLAWRLIQTGQRVLVMDDGHHSAASKMAAGMINPLAGMRFNCHPNTDSWLDAALKQYQTLEHQFDKYYWHPLAMQRLFRSAGQKRFYARQLNANKYPQYLGAELGINDIPAHIQAPYGGFWQDQTGYVDMPALLQDIRDWLQQHNALCQQACDYQHIQLSNNQVSYQGICARHLVFCEGYRMQTNPWFNHLPMQPDKGEILTLGSDQTICKTIINSAHWLIPLHNGDYRFGATHEHISINHQITDQGKAKLQQELNQLLKTPNQMNIKSHLAGVRPATQDRQPFIGAHPEYPRLHVFNGFGAHGALRIPWHATQFANHLMNGADLPAEANIQRYQ